MVNNTFSLIKIIAYYNHLTVNKEKISRSIDNLNITKIQFVKILFMFFSLSKRLK